MDQIVGASPYGVIREDVDSLGQPYYGHRDNDSNENSSGYDADGCGFEMSDYPGIRLSAIERNVNALPGGFTGLRIIVHTVFWGFVVDTCNFDVATESHESLLRNRFHFAVERPLPPQISDYAVGI